ncbi:hypothetical protein DQ04_03041060 [Trypanosoma grayi]|uniref:hypothetical protein n=1 Tax=Trypanosoma grayi TaxID=71804 RepID=UPI0004F486A5|nr:hypothetical protein DQ04_03041060 [Trypanosoma grayi]KEG11035.1 hypothetical protein DQ04_03041060 [Trypanosoma grayi]
MRRVSASLCHSLPSCGSFVAEALRTYPDSCFSDILSQWANHRCSPDVTPPVSLEEDKIKNGDAKGRTSAHINAKLYDAAEVQLLNAMYENPMPARARWLLQRYTTAHFAAEVGSTTLLEMLSSQGVMLHADACMNVRGSECMYQRRRVPLDTVALSIHDGEGRFLSHLAAQYGHLSFLMCLVERLGATVVLGQCISLSDVTAGVPSLDVYETAFVYGQVPLLEWIDKFHPRHAFGVSDSNALRCVQRASAYGQVRSLEHFTRCHGTASRTTLCEALYPAAEAGADVVLNFLLETLGEGIVWRSSKTGATILHHAARFGRTSLLDVFFQRYNVRQHVDDRDDRGRTPAMWCVLGGKKPRNIAFLERLLELGSRWPVDTDDDGRDVGALARMCYMPTAKMCKFIEKCVMSAQRRGD